MTDVEALRWLRYGLVLATSNCARIDGRENETCSSVKRVIRRNLPLTLLCGSGSAGA